MLFLLLFLPVVVLEPGLETQPAAVQQDVCEAVFISALMFSV